MKRNLLSFKKYSLFLISLTFLLFFKTPVNAINYYSKSTGNLNLTATWGQITDGTGTAPGNFTTAGNVFYIRNNATPTVGASWTVSGAGSKVVLGDGTNACNFTVGSNYVLTATVDISANGTLTLSTTGVLTGINFGTLATGSTVNYAEPGAQIVRLATYNNLTLSGSGAKTFNTANTINGILSMEGTATVTYTTTPTMGASSMLQYNTATARNSRSEWQSTFSGTGGVIIKNTGAITTNSAKTLSSGIPLTIDANSRLNTGTTNTWTLTVGGTTTVSGTLTLANTGIKTFTGAVIINSGGIWNNTGNSATSFAGGITHNGTTFNNGTGAAAFSATQSLAGAGNMTFGGSVTPATGTTLTNSNSGTVTINNIVLTGNFTQGSNTPTLALTNATPFSGAGTFDASTNTNTVNYTGTAQTLKVTAYHHLILSGGTKTFGAITTVAGNLTLNGTATATTAAALNIGGALDVGSGTTFATGTTNTWILGITGTTAVSGTLTLANTGTKTFTGNVTVNNGGIWNDTGVAAINFAGNLQNDGTIITNTGVHTFTGTAKTISGANSIAIPNLTISGTTSNNGTLTVSAALAGASTLTNTGTLNYGGAGAIVPTLAASATGNTVNYTGAAQTVKATTYDNLIFSGSGAKSIATGTSITGNLSIAPTGSATASLGAGLNITVGSLTLGGTNRACGTWGGTGSGATNINTTFFAATTGYLSVGIPQAAGSISGTSSVINGQTGVTYSVPAISGETSYVWAYSGTGATINGTGNSVTIDFSSTATSGNLTVAGSNGSCNGTASPAFPITVYPSAPFWYKADGATAFDGTTWNDETTNNIDAVRSSGTITLATNSVNYNPSLTFTNANQQMLTSTVSQVKSFVVVTLPTSTTDLAGLIGAGPGTVTDKGIRLSNDSADGIEDASWRGDNNADDWYNGGGSRINGTSVKLI